MQITPLIPDNAPFSAEQRAWLNGFLAGVLQRGPAHGAPAPAEAKTPLLIAFGSQSGNAESLAKRLAREATGRGFAARAAGLDSLQPADLIQDRNVLLITSTWGEGARLARAAATRTLPPEAAKGEADTLTRLAQHPHAARLWAEAAQSLSARARKGKAVNLDPAALLMDMVLKLEETAASSTATATSISPISNRNFRR